MSSEIKFSRSPGENKSWEIKLYALSTCAHCHRVMNFLKDRSIEFEYVFVDHINREIVKKLRNDVTEKFGRVLSYPFLVIDNEKYLQGFIEAKYKQMFESGD